MLLLLLLLPLLPLAAAVDAPSSVTCVPGDYSVSLTWGDDGDASHWLVNGTETTVAALVVEGLPNYVPARLSVVAVTTAAEESAATAVECVPQAPPTWADESGALWGDSGTHSLELDERLCPEAADMNGDGLVDLLVGTRYSGVLYFQRDATLSLGQETSPIDTGDYERIKVRITDFDGDGDEDDAVVGTDQSGVRLYLDLVEATTNPFSAVTCMSTGSVTAPAVGDLDGDGDVDVVVGNNGLGGIYVCLNDGGAFSDAGCSTLGYSSPPYPVPALIDLDGDGDLDMVVGDVLGNVVVVENLGSPASPSFATSSSSLPTGALDVGSIAAPAARAGFGIVVGNDSLVEYHFAPHYHPEPPTAVAATISGSSAQLSWQPSTLGGPVDEYTVDDTHVTTGTSLTIGGLTVGAQYSWTVVASNAYGDAAASDPSASIPSAPLNATVAEVDGAAMTVAWSPPDSDGGSAVLSYNVYVQGVLTTNTVELDVEYLELDSGIGYYFQVSAINAVGESALSDATDATYTDGTPTEPQDLHCAAGDNTVTATWTAPQVDGGETIVYDVGDWTTTSLVAVFTNLPNYEPFSVSVMSTSPLGSSVAVNCTATPRPPTSLVSSQSNPFFSGAALSSTASRFAPWLFYHPDAGTNLLVAGTQSEGVLGSSFVAVSYGEDSFAQPAYVDIDGDGDIDYFVGLDNELRFFENIGSGLYSESTFAVATLTTHPAPAFVDFDLDGDLDILLGGEFEMNLCINSEGVFTTALCYTLSNTLIKSTADNFVPAFIDVNGDGDARDMVVGIGDGGCYYLLYDAVTNGWGSATRFVNVGSFCAPAALDGIGVLVGNATHMDQWWALASPPEAPTGVVAAASYSAVTVSWDPPSNDGGLAVLEYEVRNNVSSSVATAAAASTSIAIEVDLSVAYSFTVTAVNAAGAGPSSAPSNGAAIEPVPSEPRNVTCSCSDYSLTITWAEPEFHSGHVTAYLVSTGDETDGATTVLALRDRVNYEAVNATVAAVTSSGVGPASSPCDSCTPQPEPALVETTLPVTVSGSRLAPELCDYNGDGHTDLIVGTESDGLWLFAGPDLALDHVVDFDGVATFLRPRLLDVGSILLGTANAGFLVHEINGSTTTASPAGSPGTFLSPAVKADDGELFYGSNEGGQGVITGNDSAVAFTAPGVGTAAPTMSCDYDGDGDIDALVGDDAGAVYLIRNELPHGGWVPVATPVLQLSDAFAVPTCVTGVGIVAASSSALGGLWVGPAAHPEPPLAVSVDVVGLGYVELSWDTPQYDGGAEITQYLVLCNDSAPAATTATATATTVTTRESCYFSVVSQNVAGNSTASPATALITPLGTTLTVDDDTGLVQWPLSAEAQALVSQVRLSWLEFRVTLPSSYESYTLTDLRCVPYSVKLELLNTGYELSVDAAPPAGVCPRLCPSDSGWIDTTQLAPFEVACIDDGNWTVLDSDPLVAGDQQTLLSDVCAETLFFSSNQSDPEYIVDVPLFPTGVLGTQRNTSLDVVLEVGTDSAVTLGSLLPYPSKGLLRAAVRTAPLALETTASPAADVNVAVDLQTAFAFSVNVPAADVEVSVDGGAWALWAEASYNATEGPHYLEARATHDWLGESDSQRFDWTHDFTAPVVTFAESPDAVTSDASATFGIAASEEGVTFSYCVDDALCADYVDVEQQEGATDRPVTTLLSVSTDDAAVVIEVAVSSGSVQVSVDESTAWSLSTTTVEVDDLSDGWHSVHVRGIADGVAGDTVGVAVSISPSEELPDTTVTAAPAAFVQVGEAATVVAVSSVPDVAVEYSLDGGASWTTADNVTIVDADAPAAHMVLARAVGDPTPALVAWQSAFAPKAELVLAPPVESVFALPVFAVEVSGGSQCEITFEVDATGESGEADVDGAIVLTEPLEFGPHDIVIETQCVELSANTLTHQWSTTAEAASEEFTVVVEEGPHTATLQGVDLAGNMGESVTFEWVVDRTPPDTNVTWASSGFVSPTANVSLQAACVSEVCSSFNVMLDDGNWTVVDSPDLLLVDVASGRHSVNVSGVDLAGNVDPSPAEFAFAVDPRGPVLVMRPSSGYINEAEFTIACYDFFSDCVDLQYWGAFSGNETGTLTPDLADGAYELNITASDEVGNLAALYATFVLDTIAPNTTLAVVVTNGSTVTLVPECQDSSPCTVNTSVPLLTSTFDDGDYVLEAWAVDAAGNVDATPAVVSITVDTLAPQTRIESVVYNASGSVAWLELGASEEDATFSASSSSVAVQVLDNVVTVAGGDGAYTVCAWSTDAVGNEGAANCTDVLLDATPPLLSFVATPAPETRALVADFQFAVVEANLAGCDHPPDVPFNVTLPGNITEAAMAVTVTCSDVRGHSSSLSYEWTVDRVAPVLEIDWDVAVTNAADWSFGFTGGDSGQCTLYFSGFLIEYEPDCTSPWAASDLVGDEGAYMFAVEVADAAGNSASQNVSFVYDATPPELVVLERPTAISGLLNPTFEVQCVVASTICSDVYENDPDCLFSYRLDDNQTAVDTAASFTLGDVAEGVHTIDLMATDSAGNVAVETVEWTFSQAAITPEFLVEPAEKIGVTRFEFEFQVDAADVQLEQRLNGGEWTSDGIVTVATYPATVARYNASDLVLDTYSFEVRVFSFDDSVTSVFEVAECQSTGEVAYIGSFGALTCDACPDQGVTCEDGVAEMEPGYWRASDSAEVHAGDVFYACPIAEACKGGSACAEGYTGTLCAVCVEGYASTLQGACATCGDTSGAWVTVLVGVFGSILLGGLAMLVIKRSLRTGAKSRTVATIKIMANYFLFVSILKDLDLDWGSMVSTLFSYVGVLSGGGAADVQLFNCAFSVSVYSRFAAFFMVPVALVVLPAAMIWGFVALMRSYWWIAGREQKKHVFIWDVKPSFLYRQSLMVLFYFLYSLVVVVPLEVLHCDEIDGRWLLVNDYSEECSGEVYRRFYWLAVAYLCVVVPGIPLSMFLFMRKYKDAMHSDSKTSTAYQAKWKKQFFFIIGEYRPEFYWWEMTVMLRKFCMIAITVRLREGWQVYVGTWLLLFSFVAQVVYLPHAKTAQRRMETASQATLLCTLLLGQALAFTNEHGSLFRGLIFGINVAVITTFDAVLIRELVREAKEKLRQSARLVQSTRINSTRLGRAFTLTKAPPSPSPSPSPSSPSSSPSASDPTALEMVTMGEEDTVGAGRRFSTNPMHGLGPDGQPNMRKSELRRYSRNPMLGAVMQTDL